MHVSNSRGIPIIQVTIESFREPEPVVMYEWRLNEIGTEGI